MVTIKDIAKVAGVSYVSVSKALNDEPGVSEKTRRRIKAIAKEMNYVPNLAAKRLVQKKTNYVGLIWPSMKGLFFYDLNLQLHKEGLKRGYNVVVSMGEPAEALRVFNQVFADYVIFWSSKAWVPSEQFLQEKERFSGEMLILGGGATERAHRLDIDRFGGIYHSVEQLASKGHRKIVFIGGVTNKRSGYEQACIDFQLEVRSENFIHLNDQFLPQKLSKLLMEERATAIIADSQGAFFRIAKLLKSLEVRIPDEVELVVYDDIPEKELFDMPFTIVGPSSTLLAERAFDILTGTIQPNEGEQWVDGVVETYRHYYDNKQ